MRGRILIIIIIIYYYFCCYYHHHHHHQYYYCHYSTTTTTTREGTDVTAVMVLGQFPACPCGNGILENRKSMGIEKWEVFGVCSGGVKLSKWAEFCVWEAAF